MTADVEIPHRQGVGSVVGDIDRTIAPQHLKLAVAGIGDVTGDIQLAAADGKAGDLYLASMAIEDHQGVAGGRRQRQVTAGAAADVVGDTLGIGGADGQVVAVDAGTNIAVEVDVFGIDGDAARLHLWARASAVGDRG